MSSLTPRAVHGVGLGLRRIHFDALESAALNTIDFLELAPENWIAVGGAGGERIARLRQRWPFVAHGLSLSIGGTDPLSATFLDQIRGFLTQYRIAAYSDHLSASAIDGQLYELLPLPFTREGVRHVADRIKAVQDHLGQRIAIENPSYYVRLGHELSELEFTCQILESADCGLLLDVNNVYVNACNHGFDPYPFIRALPGARISYIHVAGHEARGDLLLDTHGAAVPDPVFALLEHTYGCFGPVPTLIERDQHIPPLAELLPEIARVRELQLNATAQVGVAA